MIRKIRKICDYWELKQKQAEQIREEKNYTALKK